MGRVLVVLIVLFSRGVYALDCPAGETPTTVYEVTSVSAGSCSVGDRAPTAQALADACAAQGTPMHSSGFWKERFGESVVISGSQLGTISYGTPYSGPPATRQDAGPEVQEGVVGTALYHEITVCEGGNTCVLDSGIVHHFLVPIDVSVGEIWCIGGCDVPVQRYAANGSVTQLMATGAGMGSSCTESDGTTNDLNNTTTLPDSSPGACVPGSSTCLSDTKSNCGYVNGEYRCVTSSQLTDDHPCAITASGGVFCKADAPSQPDAPTNPDGSVSSPDAHFAITTVAGVTYVNYYGDTTVQNGSQNPGGDADGDKGKGDCGSKNTPCHVVVDSSGGGDGEGNGYGYGDGQCTGANCGTNAPGFGGVDSFGATLSKFVGDVQGSQIAVAMSHLGDSVPQGGTAPSACFNAFDQQYCYAVPDEVVASVQSILPLVMQAFWCLVGIVTFMKA